MVCLAQAALNSGANILSKINLTAHATPAQRVRATAQEVP
jgi:hypothetical protein